MREDRLKDDDMLELIKLLAPGTLLREGLENILKARTGGLIVISDSDEVLSLVDGGFLINKEYSPAHLYELAKMDGAIIISKDLKKVLYANTLLIPNPSIPTIETGSRHKTAERVAKQTSEIVISISQRRNIITVYRGYKKYILKETHTILVRANQALQTLEKYKSVLDVAINKLNIVEYEDMVTLEDIAVVIQRVEMVLRIASEIDRYLCELGNEGRLIKMQLEELVASIEIDGLYVIEDYMNREKNNSNSGDVEKQLRNFTHDELTDLINILKILGYAGGANCFEISVSPKGYRILNKIPRLPLAIIRNLVEKFNDFQGILGASIEELDDVDGIGEVRARTIKNGLRKIQEQFLIECKKG